MTEEIIKEEFDKAFKKNFPEAVIIDGVNVAGCEYFDRDSSLNNCLAHCIPYPECTCYESCDEHPDCYYKQLKRLEQLKNKYYQQTLDDEIQINNLLEEIQQIKQDRNVENISRLSLENKRLEQENKELKEKIIKLYEEKGHLIVENNTLKEENEGLKIKHQRHRECSMQLNKKYKSALEEIRGLASPHCTQCSQILNIINEVLK